ncbi:MAG: phosphopantetheine-binding protein [bacterium]|nr:phosphopantetheine-binding protein [bacterium]
MSRQEILDKIIDLISALSSADEITEDSEIIEDLGIGSMDVLHLISLIEVDFNIKFPEKAIRNLVVVGDIADTVESLL